MVKQVRNHYSNWGGGDPIIGTTTKAVELLMNPETECM
jgi:hypothetical protein